MGWRSRFAEWMEPPRRLRPTRAGWWFLLGILAVGVAAVNTGNNLLYFVLGMMLGAVVVSGVLSERDLRGIDVERVVGGGVHAGTPAALAYRVSCAGRWPRLAIGVRDRDADGTFGPEVLFPRLDANPRRRGYERTFAARGVRRIGEVELSTLFPFGLFRKSRRIDLESEVRVRPRLPAIDLPELLVGREDGVAPATARGEGLDLFGLRDHREGDEARRIHWKASARLGKTIVKDPARDEPPAVLLVLRGSRPGVLFEQTVERAAGMIVGLLGEGFAVGLVAGGVPRLAPMAGPPAREALLDALVDVTPGGDADDAGVDPRIARLVVIGAGADMLMIIWRRESKDAAKAALLAAVKSGELPQARVDEAVRRTIAAKMARGLFAPPPRPDLSIVGNPHHKRIARDIAERAITVIANAGGAIPCTAAVAPRIVVLSSSDDFLAAMRRLRAGSAEVHLPPKPDAAAQARVIATAKRLAANADRFVIAVSNAEQAQLADGMARALGPKKPVIGIDLGAPYLLDGDAVAAHVCAYGSRPDSIDAAVRVVAGLEGAVGHAPVRLSSL